MCGRAHASGGETLVNTGGMGRAHAPIYRLEVLSHFISRSGIQTLRDPEAHSPHHLGTPSPIPIPQAPAANAPGFPLETTFQRWLRYPRPQRGPSPGSE